MSVLLVLYAMIYVLIHIDEEWGSFGHSALIYESSIRYMHIHYSFHLIIIINSIILHYR